VPTTTATYVQPSTNITIPSTGAAVPTYTQVPVGGAASLQAGSAMAFLGIVALVSAFLMN
jgi:hypothetical protein